MKNLVLILALTILAFTGNAQNAIAKIRYEQAEEAFAKNDFTTTLAKLDDAEKLLGNTNPKILYLRIMARKGIIATNNYEFDVLVEARKNTEFFIKNYEKNEGIEEKFKEVFLFYEELEKLPKTPDELKWQKEAPQKELARKKAVASRFADSLANIYQFKKGLTEEAFRAYNSFSAKLVKKIKINKESVSYFGKNHYSPLISEIYKEGPESMNITNGIVSNFIYVLKSTSAAKNNLNEARFLFENYKKRIHELFPAGEISESNTDGETISVRSVNSELVNSLKLSLFGLSFNNGKYVINVVKIEFE